MTKSPSSCTDNLMKFSSKEIDKLIKYLEKREISPGDAIDIVHASTPEGQAGNKKFNWKMLRFTMYLWKRVEQDKKGNLLSKTQTALDTVADKKYQDLLDGFTNTGIMSLRPSRRVMTEFKLKERLDKEAKNLFKLVTDPRQKHFFKSRYFVYEKRKTTIPQDHIDHLMQWPKTSEK